MTYPAWSDILSIIPSHHMPPGSPLNGCKSILHLVSTISLDTTYLEIGCRLGHSLAVVAAAARSRLRYASVVDAWIPDYGGEPNPGPESVRESLRKLSISTHNISFYHGSSHDLLPKLPNRPYNLILVDGDHTPDGANQDLNNIVRFMRSGTVIVFDDAILQLLDVWDGFAAKYNILSFHYLPNNCPPFCVGVVS